MQPAVQGDDSKITTVPSPVGGLNAYDNLASMPPTDAVVLTNLVPQPFGCTVRKGTIKWSTGMTDPVNSLAQWNSRTGATEVYGWAGANMYSITSAGAVGAPLISALTSSWWQYVQFGNSAGVHMLAFNGQDDPIWKSEAGLTRLTLGDGIVSGTWAGVNPANIIQATVHQARLWGVPVNDTVGWYLPPDAIFGVADFFDFGPFFKRGGYLAALATWTVDSGDGSDDKLVAISSNGEAVVFAGIDVASGDWALQGVYFIGAPVRGRRFFANVAGDLYIITATGIISMATVVTSTQVNVSANNTYSKKIQFLLSDLTSDLSDLDGWQLVFLPALNFLVINVPSVYSGGSGQVVANMINSAWCTFQAWNARVFIAVDGFPYFGTLGGIVYRAWFGDKDQIETDGSGGTDILSVAQQAYSYLGAPAAQKQIGMYRPNFVVVKKAGYAAKILYDFRVPDDAFAPPGIGGLGAALWGISMWGIGIWGGGMITQREWNQANGMGVAFAIRMNLSTETETTWVSTDYTYRAGGPL